MIGKTKSIARNHFSFLLGCCGAAALISTASGLAGRSAGARAIPEPVSQAAAAQAARPSLAGTWKLNKDQSDDTRQKMQQAMGNSGDGQGNGNGGGRPGRGQGGPGGPGGGGMMNEWAQLTVTQLDANVKITGASGRTLATTTPPDPTADSKSDADASNAAGGAGQRGDRRTPPVAQWQGSQLVTTGRGFGGGGGGTTRTYELSADGKQLIVTTKITNERLTQPVTYRLVYDSEKSGGSNQ